MNGSAIENSVQLSMLPSENKIINQSINALCILLKFSFGQTDLTHRLRTDIAERNVKSLGASFSLI